MKVTITVLSVLAMFESTAAVHIYNCGRHIYVDGVRQNGGSSQAISTGRAGTYVFVRHGNSDSTDVMQDTTLNEEQEDEPLPPYEERIQPSNEYSGTHLSEGVRNEQEESNSKHVHVANEEKKESASETVNVASGSKPAAKLNPNFAPALHKYITAGDLVQTKRLVGLGAPVDGCEVVSKRPLRRAIESRSQARYAIAEFLMKSGAALDPKDASEDSLISLAIKQEDVTMVGLLLQYGANPNDSYSGQQRPIRTAMLLPSQKRYDIMDLLIERGAHLDPNADNHGCLIAWAIKDADLVMLEFLLKRKASPNMTRFTSGSSQRRPLRVAMESKSKERLRMINLLLQYGAKVTPRPGQDDLLSLAIDIDEDIVELFIKKLSEEAEMA